jgi:hypothetical protein
MRQSQERNISNYNFSKLNRVASLKHILEAASPFGKVRKNSTTFFFTNTQGRSQFVTANSRELDRSDQDWTGRKGTKDWSNGEQCKKRAAKTEK